MKQSILNRASNHFSHLPAGRCFSYNPSLKHFRIYSLQPNTLFNTSILGELAQPAALAALEAGSLPCAQVRVVVMGNLLCSSAPIHRRFDLKGSTQGRFTRKTLDELKPTSVLKDLDLDTVFELPDKWYDIYDEQLRADCKLLEEVGVIDYSLLVGVHFRDAKQNPGACRW